MLQVRKKGRPLTQCDHCRDLRKVKQVHVRCICTPDESEAPKRRKGKDTSAPKQHNGCDCDNTGICNCAVPRTVASRTGRKYSGAEDRAPPQQAVAKSNCSSPSCSHTDGCSSSGEDGSCCTSSSQSSSANSDLPLSSSSTSLLLPTSAPVLVNPTDTFTSTSNSFNAFNSTFDSQFASYIPPVLNEESFLLQQQTRQKAARYTPYPQSFSALTAPGVAHVSPPFYTDYPFETVLPISSHPSDDARTAQLWDQFLRDETNPVMEDPISPATLPTIAPTTIPAPPPAVAGASPVEECTPPSDDPDDLCDEGCICIKCLTKVNPCLGQKSEAQMLDCAILMANLNLDDDEVASNMSLMSGLKPAQLRNIQKEAKSRLEEVGMTPPQSDDSLLVGKKAFEDSLKVPPSMNPVTSSVSPPAQSATTTPTTSVPMTPPRSKEAEEVLASLGEGNVPLLSKCTCPSGCTCFACSGGSQSNLTSDNNCTPCPSCAAVSESILELQRTLNVANIPALS
ncbi:hypothetical protein PIIN_06318 [Serendipita indica DSM 11827]|uniref:Copper-fist domain-containing protein n=1 Tax=Serendipita indica (strain DSM 11827) TaxID=1109443 RepID=G4TM41_SERID|nr:hypothetical protein PIIN_06318 [Serendipita indica DSM 11827]